MSAWLHADLSRPVECPVRSTLQTRAPLLTIAIIWLFLLERVERFRKRDTDGKPGDETFCNFWSVAFAWAMGVPIPQLRANALQVWFQSPEAIALGWEQVSQHVAQRMADEGQVAFASWLNPTAGPGHIAPLVPALGEPGCFVANVGATNFSRGRIEAAFGVHLADTLYFVHP